MAQGSGRVGWGGVQSPPGAHPVCPSYPVPRRQCQPGVLAFSLQLSPRTLPGLESLDAWNSSRLTLFSRLRTTKGVGGEEGEAPLAWWEGNRGAPGSRARLRRGGGGAGRRKAWVPEGERGRGRRAKSCGAGSQGPGLPEQDLEPTCSTRRTQPLGEPVVHPGRTASPGTRKRSPRTRSHSAAAAPLGLHRDGV